jgi:hypothetical protein
LQQVRDEQKRDQEHQLKIIKLQKEERERRYREDLEKERLRKIKEKEKTVEEILEQKR